jgi:WD40 repeat protein
VLLRLDGSTGAIEGRLRVGRGVVDGQRTGDGRRVFVTSPLDDETLEVDTSSLRVVRRHPAGGSAGALSPDGRALALGSRNGTVRLLDLRSGRARPFTGRHNADVLDMTFTPDGRTLVSSDSEGGVLAWDVGRGAVREELSAHVGPVWALVVSPDGRTLYSGGNDGSLILWDLVGDRRLVRSFVVGKPFLDIQTPRGIAVSPDGTTLAVTHGDGTVELLDTERLRPRGTIEATRGLFADAAAFSPDGRLLGVAGDRGRVTLFNAHDLTPAGDLTGLSGAVQALAFSPDGLLIAGADIVAERPRLLMWNVRTRGVIAQVDTPGITSIAFSPDGRLIALAALDRGTEIRNTKSGELVRHLSTEGLSRSVAFSPDGNLLAVGHFDGDGQLYSTKTWAPLGRRLEAHTQRITVVEFSRDSRLLATSSADGTVLLWDVETQEPIGSRLVVERDTFVSAAFSPDASHLFAVSTGLQGIRLETEPEVWKRHACLVAGRDLTRREWRDALPKQPYRAIC